MPSKKNEDKVEVNPEGDEPVADFDKYTEDVEGPEAEGPSEDEPHGHPFQPSTAEPVLVTHGGADDDARSQTTKAQRQEGVYRKISPSEAYDDPEFSPVANAEPPGHRGGPGAPDGEGSERAEGAVTGGTDEKAENLDYNWKNEGEQDA